MTYVFAAQSGLVIADTGNHRVVFWKEGKRQKWSVLYCMTRMMGEKMVGENVYLITVKCSHIVRKEAAGKRYYRGNRYVPHIEGRMPHLQAVCCGRKIRVKMCNMRK